MDYCLGNTGYLLLNPVPNVDHSADPTDRDQCENAKEDKQEGPAAASLNGRERLYSSGRRDQHLRGGSGSAPGWRAASSTDLDARCYLLGAIDHFCFRETKPFNPQLRRL
jgi:hypothetical protein